MYDAVILAGGENNKQLSRYSNQPYEAMIEIAGRPMVSFVAQALADSPHVGAIYVIGPVKQLKSCRLPANVHLLEGGRTITETVKKAMKELGHRQRVLVVTADIPLLTAAAIDDFVRQCDKAEADVYYPIVEREINNRHYPTAKRTYVRLKEGTFTGGNIFLVNPQIVPECIKAAEPIIDNRKNPLKLACILGWPFVLKFLTGFLSLKHIVDRVQELLGISGVVVISRYPELGIDVDKPSDLELVRTTVIQVIKG